MLSEGAGAGGRARLLRAAWGKLGTGLFEGRNTPVGRSLDHDDWQFSFGKQAVGHSAALQARDLTAVQLTPGKGEFAAQLRAARCRQGRNAHTRSLYVPRERCNVRRPGDVQIVFSSTAKPQRGQSVEIQKLLVTIAMKLSAAEVVTQYNLRWQIELFFKELKSTLGLDHHRCRDFLKVERRVAVCLLTFLYLESCRHGKLTGRLKPRERLWWISHRTHGLCRAMRQRIELEELQFLPQRTKIPGGIRRLRNTLQASAPLEFRIAT